MRIYWVSLLIGLSVPLHTAHALPAYRTATENLTWEFPSGLVDTTGGWITALPFWRVPRGFERGDLLISRYDSRDVVIAWPGSSSEDVAAYHVECHRRFNNAEEEAMLRRAEEVYPTDGPAVDLSFLHLVRGTANPGRSRQDSLAVWASSRFDGVEAPYALTMDAVRYYAALVETHAKIKKKTKALRIHMKSAAVTYSASIRLGPTYSTEGILFKNVWVAELSLTWDSMCGNMCGMGFTKNRVVVLDSSGNVLTIVGDGVTNAVVN